MTRPRAPLTFDQLYSSLWRDLVDAEDPRIELKRWRQRARLCSFDPEFKSWFSEFARVLNVVLAHVADCATKEFNEDLDAFDRGTELARETRARGYSTCSDCGRPSVRAEKRARKRCADCERKYQRDRKRHYRERVSYERDLMRRDRES